MRPAAADRPFQPLQVTLDEVDGSFERMLRRFIRKTKDDSNLLLVVARSRGFKKPSEVRRAKKPSKRD